MRRTLSFLLAATWILFLCAFANAQQTTGGIEGTIQDAAGAVVPNVTLTITTARTAVADGSTTAKGAGFKRTVTTDGDGFFRALQVPPGSYDILTTPSGGFGSSTYENVVVSIGQTTQVSIAIKPGTTVNTVDVAASDAQSVDITSSGIQTTISGQQMELVPKSTGFASLLKTVPGTRPETRSGGYSVDGSSGGENVFVLDGQEITNYRTGTLNETFNIPTQLVQEVQVKTTGFEAVYGGSTGGVISVVTRGGNNDLHGEFGLQFETPKFNGNARPLLTRFTSGTIAAGTFLQTAETFNPSKAQGTNFFPTANLSGPIIKDKLWFYSSYTPQFFETRVDTQYISDAPAATRTFIGTEQYARTRKYEYAFARLDANPFSKLRVTGTFLWNPVVDDGSIPTSTFSGVSSSAIGFTNIPFADYGGSIGRLVGNDFTDKQGGRQSSNVVTFAGVYTPTSDLVFEARYSRGFLNEKNGNYFVPQGVRIASCGSAPASFQCGITGANTITVKDVSVRGTYDFTATYIFHAGGRHELKGGYQRYNTFNDVQQGNNAIGTITFFYGGSIQTAVGATPTPGNLGYGRFDRGGTFGHGTSLSHGIFIQDKYQPTSRLTLNLGVRTEKENLPSFNEFPSNLNFSWGQKIAPRLGFAYDLFGNGTTKIFASYGRFFDRVKFYLPRDLFGGTISLQDYFEILPGEVASSYNIGNIINGYTGPSTCPMTGTIAPGARSRCQINLRVSSNQPGASPLTGSGAVDTNADPFQQTEFTVGVERQLSKNYLFRARYTHKNVDEVLEDAGITNAAGSNAFIIGNPGKGLHRALLESEGYPKIASPQRVYDGMEIVLEKHLSNHWYFNANYTYSRLFGNYSGLASSDEPHLPDGRLAPGGTRAFDLPMIGFTVYGTPDNGRLPTDRPHVFNAYGAYIFDWNGHRSNSTEVSAFQTITSGTPQTTTFLGGSTATPQLFYGRGDMGRSPTFSQTDLAVTHRYRFGRDRRYTMAFDLNFLNLFDQATVTSVWTTLNPTGTAVYGSALGITNKAYNIAFQNGTLLNQILARINSQADRKDLRYGMPNTYQSPRTVRFGFRLLF